MSVILLVIVIKDFKRYPGTNCLMQGRCFIGGVAQWVARLTRDRWIPVSREFEPHQKAPVDSLSKKLSLLSTGWFQERIRA